MKRTKPKASNPSQGAFGSRPAFGASSGSQFGGFGTSHGASSLSYLTEPPSLTAISDPNVVVNLKNVLKKDATTKAKGLEDLVAYAQSHPYEQDGGVEDAVLDAWVQIYPRTSIDNARRVRELSHSLQLELVKSTRKRMEKRIPSVVGAWLAGLYDRDRGVARAANDGFSTFLTSPEKVVAFWQKCHSQILDFALGAIQETKDTLSDERSTTEDDAESKHARVVTASLSLVLGLLLKVTNAAIEEQTATYEDFFSQEGTWESLVFKDVSARKAAYQLIFVCLDRKLAYVDSPKIRLALVSGGLRANQTGSALEYVRVLTKLTAVHPDIWTPGAKAKKSPITMLQAFIAKGSQGSPMKYWEHLDQLLSTLPSDILTLESALELLTAIKSGITNREDPHTNTSASWKCFIDTSTRLLSLLNPEEGLELAEAHLFPLFEDFISLDHANTRAIPRGVNAMSILVEAYAAVIGSSAELTSISAEKWDHIGNLAKSNMSASTAEADKDFLAAQDKVAEQGRRWFGLIGQIHARLSASDMPDHVTKPSAELISQYITVLEEGAMKNSGAARSLEYALSTSGYLFRLASGKPLMDFLNKTGEQCMNTILQSPSASYLFSCVRLLGAVTKASPEFEEIWTSWIDTLLNLEGSAERDTALAALVSAQEVSPSAQNNPRLQEEITARIMASVKGEAESWELLEGALAYNGISDDTCHELARQLVSALEDQNTANVGKAFKALNIVAKTQKDVLTKNEAVHTALVTHSLRLSEISDDTVSAQAAGLRSVLDQSSSGKLPIVGIIHTNLERAGPHSLEIETLVRQALDAFKSGVPPEDLFPNTDVWLKVLDESIGQGINPSVAITNNLGVAAASLPASDTPKAPTPRDRQGLSTVARMALYTCRLPEANVSLTALPVETQVSLLFLQCITVQLVTDQVNTLDRDGLWKTMEDSRARIQSESLISSLRSYISERAAAAKWWTDEIDSEGQSAMVMERLVSMLMDRSVALDPRSFFCARALCEILQAVAENEGLPSALESKLFSTKDLQARPRAFFKVAALLVAFSETLQPSKPVNNFCNRLVSDVAAASLEAEDTQELLAMLAVCAGVYPEGELPVANNRIVFATRQVTSWLDEPASISPPLRTAICSCLTKLLPSMKDVYGSYWEATINFCIWIWLNAEEESLDVALPSIHASLRLMKTLEVMPEPNDDLLDALKEAGRAKSEALIKLLQLPRDIASQPLQIVDATLSREIQKMDVARITDLSDIYGLVASESTDVQSAAFDLLHRAIPVRQEQLSVDLLLDKTDAKLPDELLSLLLEAPTIDNYSDDALAHFPSAIRGFLLSWKLVFDAYSASSFKIRGDLSENLKAGNYVKPLLEFTFDVLGHSAAHPLKLAKVGLGSEQIANYDLQLADAEPEEKNMQWLLVHLYYLTLKCVPGLFRTWYIDCRSKQTKIAVEQWTTQYFSPMIIAEALNDVQQWTDNQDAPAIDEQELQVRVSKPAREVTAGFEVDESMASIAIRVPQSYPIDSVTVQSLHRVAVTEGKWQNWIMTTQGVITFSNGNIIDGLQVFRRNFMGALKGQSECAICYSILASDKRMPDKRCTTCKNLFHRSCLYKWFQTSNQNTCPLCRNPIDYLGADTAKRRQ